MIIELVIYWITYNSKLQKQLTLDADSKAIQETSFTGNLNRAGNNSNSNDSNEIFSNEKYIKILMVLGLIDNISE